MSIEVYLLYNEEIKRGEVWWHNVSNSKYLAHFTAILSTTEALLPEVILSMGQ